MLVQLGGCLTWVWPRLVCQHFCR